LNEGGTGGSEEAVIRLSRELAEMGWLVTVYGTPGTKAGPDYYRRFSTLDEDLYNGGKGTKRAPVWRHYWEFSNKDSFDVLISWRQPALFDFEIKARRKYLWLHDVIPAEELTKDRIDNLTKIIYVSKYHSERKENTHVPKAKKLPSGNGITPDDFTRLDGQFERDAKRCIYMSANERGLRILYDIWPDVRKAVPEATLDVYYGWHSFDAVNRDNPERMAWKAHMVARAQELEGVTERGRIGQDELNEEIFKSGVFAYPCTFPEVNCITAQKAMAGGAVPVTSDFAALKNIIKYGEQVPMGKFGHREIEKYKQRLIWWLQHPEEQDRVRRPMMKWARQEFDWKNTAKQWDGEMK
jgi:glycosyltransferase involved in cell wall biosynthesis